MKTNIEELDSCREILTECADGIKQFKEEVRLNKYKFTPAIEHMMIELGIVNKEDMNEYMLYAMIMTITEVKNMAVVAIERQAREIASLTEQLEKAKSSVGHRWQAGHKETEHKTATVEAIRKLKETVGKDGKKLTNKEIAAKLHCTESTVYRKLKQINEGGTQS